MVCFCGAGISVPTGLPNFRRLVEQLYTSLNVPKTSRERKLIKAGKLDKALDSLERRLAPNKMRSEVARQLSSAPKQGSLTLHRALLRISRNPSGIHLVTTNYDDNFAHANCSDGLHFEAGPTLPDLDNWDSIVHLHGRIRASAEKPKASPLVLTSTDFGEAYLTKRWAARFVSSLMGRYTVVFVGYSMADVVLSYLTEAIARQQVDNRIYSLVGYKDQQQREQRELKWSENGIRPIPYDSCNGHELLVRTVEEWAKLAADPHQYRVQLALSGLKGGPNKNSHETDPDRVVWALKNPAAAWPVFNRIRRTPVPGSYAAEWLHQFAINGLLGGTVQPTLRERGLAGPVITSHAPHQLLQPDSLADAVSFWIEIHMHSPEVFQWVIKHGHNIHLGLSRRLWDRLVSTENDLPDIPPRLARLWTLLLVEPPEDEEFLLRLDSILNNLSRTHCEATDDILLRLLRPRLVVFPGPAPYRIIPANHHTRKQVALLSCGHTDVILGCRDTEHRFNVLTQIEPAKFTPFLKRHAVTITEYLKTALELLHQSDRGDAQSIDSVIAVYCRSPTEARWTGASETTQSELGRRETMAEDLGTWTLLLSWVQESYRALPEDGMERESLLHHWVASNEKILMRIALETIEQDSTADFGLVGNILLRNGQEVLWDPDCSREVRAVLRHVGKRASPNLQGQLLEALQARLGSSRSRPESDGSILAEVGPRLVALHQGGVILGRAAAQTLAIFESRRGAVRRHQPEASGAALRGRIREVVATVRGGSVDVARFREFAEERPVAAILVLRDLGRTGNWPAEMWKAALNSVRKKVEDKAPRNLHRARLIQILLDIPDDLFIGLQHETARIVDVLAERWPADDDSEFWRLWMRGWKHRSQRSSILSPVDALNRVLNTTAGAYAGAAMKRIREITSKGSRPITNERLSILGRIARDDSGSAGIVMLVFWLDWLYRNAAHWVDRHMLPRMRWERTTLSDELHEEVRALWEVVAFCGSISFELVRALGADLWTAVQRHKDLHHGEKLVRFFVHVSLSSRSGLIDESTSAKTARIVIRDSPLQVGLALQNVLDKGNQPCEQEWRESVRPWLDRNWPHERSLNTGESSRALVGVIMKTGDAFPEAVDWAIDYLMASNDRQINTVCYHKNTWRPFPREVIRLMHRIVPDVGIDPWARASLVDMLNTLREVDTTVPQDPRFVELEQRAAQ